MRFCDFLDADRIVLPLESGDKWQAIGDLMANLEATGAVPKDLARELHDAVLARERSMSTGMERGIAIPHAAVDGLEEPVATLGVITREGGLPFDSLDAEPTQFVVLLLIPRSQKLVHIRTLAEIARLLGAREVREKLLACEEGTSALACLNEAEARLG